LHVLNIKPDTSEAENIEAYMDDLCSEWEAGVGEGYEWQLAQLAKSALE
jgi:hypothetical protein